MTEYLWTDNPTAIGSECNPDILNESLMHLKYDKTTKFTVNSGNFLYSKPNILDYSGSTLKFKVGNIYPDIVLTNAQGKVFSLSSVNSVSVSSLANGEYVAFVGPDGSVETVLKSLIYKDIVNPYTIPSLSSNSTDGFISSGSNILSTSSYYQAISGYGAFSAINSYVKLEMPCLMKTKKWLVSSTLDTKHIKTGRIEVLDKYGAWTTVVNINETSIGSSMQKVYNSDYPDLEFKAYKITCLTNFGATNGCNFGGMPVGYEVTQWTGREGSIWVDYTKEPMNAYKMGNNGFEKFDKVPVGSFKVSSGTITQTNTFFFNQNGYDMNAFLMAGVPDMSKKISKNQNTYYTAETNGWLYGHVSYKINSTSTYVYAFFDINNIAIYIWGIGGIGALWDRRKILYPLNKGDVYRFRFSNTGNAPNVEEISLNFVPNKGEI